MAFHIKLTTVEALQDQAELDLGMSKHTKVKNQKLLRSGILLSGV